MIRKPLNFVLGILCGFCCIVNIFYRRDPFVMCITLSATLLNFAEAFTR